MSTPASLFTLTFIVLFLIVLAVGLCKAVGWAWRKFFDYDADNFS